MYYMKQSSFNTIKLYQKTHTLSNICKMHFKTNLIGLIQVMMHLLFLSSLGLTPISSQKTRLTLPARIWSIT